MIVVIVSIFCVWGHMFGLMIVRVVFVLPVLAL